MSSSKHCNERIDTTRTYEENQIGLKGILGFGAGLTLLIVITFGLMWLLLGALKDTARENADPANPMAMKEKDRLPPEPRLQLAPGFGVETAKGRVNLELLPPAAEYIEIRKQWDELWKNGQKDKKTGMMSVMPIETAKEKFLAQNVKARSGAEAEKSFKDSHLIVSDSSAGRVASEQRK